jgi:hypothetical protein
VSRPVPPSAVDGAYQPRIGPSADSRRQPVPTACRSALPPAQPPYAHCPDLPVPLEVPGLTYRDTLRSDRRRSRNRPGGPRIEGSRCPRTPGYPGSDPDPGLLCWRPVPAPHSGPRGDGVRHSAREADRGTPSGSLKETVFRLTGAGLPCRIVCLPAAQGGHETGSRGEACALPDSSCLTACLTPQPPSRENHDTGNQPEQSGPPPRTQGVNPPPPPATALVTGR